MIFRQFESSKLDQPVLHHITVLSINNDDILIGIHQYCMHLEPKKKVVIETTHGLVLLHATQGPAKNEAE